MGFCFLTNSLLELKTFIIMAIFELKFIDCFERKDFIQVDKIGYHIRISGKNYDGIENFSFQIDLDKSTAIKFAKTLRTEINKITESEVSNG